MIVTSISIVEPDIVVDKDWWRGAVIYQIYPRSYQDSNNDGVGDLAGIKDRLHHIAELGADAVWISPFFKSPMKDFGYDVSGYKDIDPMFGDLHADLNFHNTDVQDALLDVARFWLDRGVDGFRLDTINFYFCDQQLRDNPALAPELRNADTAPEVNPYNYQDHLYDKSRPENLDFLARFREVLDEYPGATSVGEIGDAQNGMQVLSDYTTGTDRVHMCYTFDFLSGEYPSAQRVAEVLARFENEAPDSWVCWAFSNHDVVRHVTRWNLPKKQRIQHIKLLASLLMSMRGSVCLYQGEELGLPEADIPFEKLQDPYGIAFWPEFKGRDGCRTPMVWDTSEEQAGFSSVDPWLPIPDVHKRQAVSAQEGVTDSVLEHYRQFLRFRTENKALIKGTLTEISVLDNLLSFVRTYDDEMTYCAFNLGSERVRCEVDTRRQLRLLQGHGFTPDLIEGALEIPGYSAAYLALD